ERGSAGGPPERTSSGAGSDPATSEPDVSRCHNHNQVRQSPTASAAGILPTERIVGGEPLVGPVVGIAASALWGGTAQRRRPDTRTPAAGCSECLGRIARAGSILPWPESRPQFHLPAAHL